ncbi:TadE/TadG family type IV pilus assembly protein [Jannaschia rubra]|uniref:TadE/TadG family type IV pilus assembly protein n=1 Tax=Jannaschia rubra TaxID=282197 RepID=UPI002493773E|nr:hypothetical protein [Jannaschia rubra]
MQSPPSRLPSALRRFAEDEFAALSIEAAFLLPVLCLLYVAGYQFFDSYRRETQMIKANFAVADMLSRRVSLVTPADLDGLQRVYETMTFSTDASYMRFTEVRRGANGMEVIWSYATDGQPGMTTERLQGYLNQIPRLDLNERVTLVESYTYDAPFFSVGLKDRIVDRVTPISQRYAARLAFAPGNGQENNGSVTGNNTDCGTNNTILIDGQLIVGAGNCTES